MRQRFDFLPEYLDTLRCFECDTLRNGSQMRCVLIFSPYLAHRQHIAIRVDADLEKHPEVLLYEGYIDAQDGVHIEDRRITSQLASVGENTSSLSSN
jgi:hypothetical protein